jgi:hypothetical protein
MTSTAAAAFFGWPGRRLTVIGVTGTDGKTTTVRLISDVLEAAGERTGYATTVDFKMVGTTWANETRQTTQEALEVQQFFAELAVAGATWGVLEATSHSLALRKLRNCHVDVAVFTNLSPEHLDFHGTLQSYLEAKGILFEQLAASRDKGLQKAAVLNADDPRWSYLADPLASAVLSPIKSLYSSCAKLIMSSLSLSPATLSDFAYTTPPSDNTATSHVPPPISTIKFPPGSCTASLAPMAAAIGSSMRNTSRAPAESVASRTAFFSTSVTPKGIPTITLGPGLKRNLRL